MWQQFFGIMLKTSMELLANLTGIHTYTKKEADIKLEQFFKAVKNGRLSTVKNILHEGFYIDNHCPQRFISGSTSFCTDSTPLMVAIQYKQEGIIDLLLSKGANAVRNEPLLLASVSGNIKLIKKLFKHGAKPNLSTLMASVKNNHIELSKIFLEKGVSIEDKRQSTLQESIKNRNVEMLKLLISKGGNVNWRNGNGLTLLQTAYDKVNREIVQVLENNNAAIPSGIYHNRSTNKPHSNNKIAYDAIRYNDIKKIKELILLGYKFSLKTPNINVALSSAAKLGNIEMLRLIEKNATFSFDINDVIESVMRNTISQEIDNYKLEDINKIDIWGRSALYYSIVFKNKKAFNALVRAGASISSTKKAASPLFASIKWSLDVTDFILKRGKHSESQLNRALYTVVKDNNINMASRLLDAGAKPSSPKRKRKPSPIYIATKNKNTYLIKLLLKYDVDPTQGFSPRTHYVSSIGYAIIKNMDKSALDMIHYSNKNIVDPKYGNSKGLALISGKYELLDLMLKKDKSNIDKLLFEAVSKYSFKGASLLLEHGANPSLKNKSNKTVIEKLKERKIQLSKYDKFSVSEEIDNIDSMINLITEFLKE